MLVCLVIMIVGVLVLLVGRLGMIEVLIICSFLIFCMCSLLFIMVLIF